MTTAQVIGAFSTSGDSRATAANDAATGPQVVGYSYVGSSQRAYYWQGPAGEMVDLGTAGAAMGIDQLGTTIAGSANSTNGPYQPVVWTASGGQWIMSSLPIDAGATSGMVFGLSSDASGAAAYIVGTETVKAGKGKSTVNRALRWSRDGSGNWVLSVLSGGSVAFQVNASGMAVGMNGSAPVFWDAAGQATNLPAPTGGAAQGIDAAGTVVAGYIVVSASTATYAAAYWTAQIDGSGNRTWSGPTTLPGGCERAVGVSADGTIVAQACTSGSAVFKAPYTSFTTLFGLGGPTNGATVWAISPGATRIVGTGGGNPSVSVWWPVF